MIRIELTEIEERLARFVALRRHAANRARGVRDAKIGDQSASQTDIEGCGAELAFCKHMNVYPDLQCEVWSAVDARTVEFGSVDVKATVYPDGSLLAVHGKIDGVLPDTYALMTGRMPVYFFAGWTTRERLLRSDNLRRMRADLPETYALKQQDLRAS
jgi:hypothetical protein